MQNLEEQWEQIKAVQGLIERCLQQHMNQVRRANTKISTLKSWVAEGIRLRLEPVTEIALLLFIRRKW